MVPVDIYNFETREHIGTNHFQKIPNRGEYIILTHDGTINFSNIRDTTVAYKVALVILHGNISNIYLDLSERITGL